MDYVIVMAAVSALAIGNSLFFGTYLFQTRKDSYPNKLLALLLFALALRITKSVIIIAFPDASEVYPAIGLIGMAAIGPLVYLYIQALFGVTFHRLHLCHFMPSLIIAITVAVVDEGVIYLYYQLVVLQIMIYLLWAGWFVQSNFSQLRTNQLKKEWCLRLLSGVGAIWLAFLYQLFADSFLSYIIATGAAVVVLYFLSFWAMQRRKLFSYSTHKSGNGIQLKEVAESTRLLFEKEKIYREEDVTLNKVSGVLNQPAYLISRAINEVFHQTFPEFVNGFRIEEAKMKLENDPKKALSIESIAYDSGFSTLSAFYSSFKKKMKMTPAQYRDRQSA